MKINYLILILFFIAYSACSHKENTQTKDKCFDDFSEFIKEKGELVFYDNISDGIGPNNSSLVLRFQESYKISISSYAYDLKEYHGYYKIIDGAVIIILPNDANFYSINIKHKSFPELLILPVGKDYKIVRRDGRKDLEEHWNIYEKHIKSIFPLKSSQ